MKFIEIKAPAKINIGLNIVEKRDDGYHNLETFFYPVNDLFDILKFEHSNQFDFFCDKQELNEPDDNLVVKAKILLERVTDRSLPVKITLTKNIPAGAGLGGGSSDAAATLISLNEFFRLNISHNNLIDLALELGSDVPFFLKAKPAIGRSRGEKLSLIDFELPYNIILVNPGIHVSTKEAFSVITPGPSNMQYEEVFENLSSFESNKNLIVNDFEKYVFQKYPEIKAIKNKLIELGADFALMSGSGSTVYGLFKKDIQLDKIKNSFSQKYFIYKSMPYS